MYRTLVLLTLLSTSLAASIQDGDKALSDSPTSSVADQPKFTSALLGPLELGETPPELRTLAGIKIDPASIPADRFPDPNNVTEEERAAAGLELAKKVVKHLRAGGDWYEASLKFSGARNRVSGSVLGTLSRGLFQPEFDDFLFSSEVGTISDPVLSQYGIFILTRLTTFAGCRAIVIRGTGEVANRKVLEVRARVGSGTPFKDLTEEYSSHPGSSGRGGQWAIYERGGQDSHLKLATFRAKIGDIVGPFESDGSLYLVQRVPVSEIDPKLAENNWIRLRSIIVSYDFAKEGLLINSRGADEAALLAEDLRLKIEAGSDMGELAAEFTDDPTGRERMGDLGWIHRARPNLPPVIKQVWTSGLNKVTRVIDVKVGFAIFRREG